MYCLDVLVDLSESAAEQWLHYHHRYVTLMQFVVEIFGIGVCSDCSPWHASSRDSSSVSASKSQRISPLSCISRRWSNTLHISVIGESEITYIAFLALILMKTSTPLSMKRSLLLYTAHSHTHEAACSRYSRPSALPAICGICRLSAHASMCRARS